MNLREYFKKYLVSSKKFCKESGIIYQSFYGFYTGRTKVSLGMALQIERFTRGEVTCEDMEKINEQIEEARKRTGKNFRGLYVDEK